MNHLYILQVIAFWSGQTTLPMTSRFFFFFFFLLSFNFQHVITCLIYLKHFTHFQHWICASSVFLKEHYFSIKRTVSKFRQ